MSQRHDYPALKDYEIVGFLGQGQFGAVHKVKSKTSGQIYACKIMRYENMSRKEKQLLHSEINLHKKLSHKNIVQYYRTILGEESKEIYLLTEYCGKGDLLKFVKEYPQKIIPEATVWNIMGQLLQALQYCHSPTKPGFDYGTVIIHRDIKPANVLIRDDGCIKLCDFGFSKSCGLNEVAVTILGSPMYTAPELFKRQPYNEKADIWSLGCVMHHVCTRAVPFIATTKEGLTKQILEDQRTPLPSQYSKELAKFLQSMITQDPDKRPSASELLLHPKFKEVGVVTVEDQHSELKESQKDIQELATTIAQKNSEIESLQAQITEQAKVIEKLERQRSNTGDLQKIQEELQAAQNEIKLLTDTNKSLRMLSESRIQLIVHLRAELDMLKEHGAGNTNSTVSSTYGMTGLHIAARGGDTDQVKKLLADDAGKRTSRGETALMFAAANGYDACVKLLIEDEAGIQDRYGGTALMRAAMNGHLGAVRLLKTVEMGVAGSRGETAMMYAAYYGHLTIVKELSVSESKKQMKDGTTALMMAIAGNSQSCVDFLLKEEGKLCRVSGETPLQLARAMGNQHLADLLAADVESCRVTSI